MIDKINISLYTNNIIIFSIDDLDYLSVSR